MANDTMSATIKDTFDFHATRIDRSKCSRRVPMKVLVLGMSRTGTLSIRAALKRLGYIDVYHGFELLFGNRSDIAMWQKAIEAKFEGKGRPFGREDWDKLLGHCQAVTDTPCILFAEELIAAYPDAKVILSVRDVDKWHDSLMKALAPDWRRNKPITRQILEAYNNIIPGRVSSRIAMDKVLKYTYGDDFRTRGKELFCKHNERIRSLVPKNRLLEYNVSEGWDPLCESLARAILDVRYPFLAATKPH